MAIVEKHLVIKVVHSRLHKGNFTCPYCNKIFARNDRLKAHKGKCEVDVKSSLENFDNDTIVETKIPNNYEENFENENLVIENVVAAENNNEIKFENENLVEIKVEPKISNNNEENFENENFVENLVVENNVDDENFYDGAANGIKMEKIENNRVNRVGFCSKC